MRSRGWSVRLKSLAGAWKVDLGPRRHATAESIKLNAILQVLLRGKLSPVSGWRVGSTHTFGHTSVRSCAVMSLIALCRMEGMAPFGQLKAWLTLNG